MKVRSKSAIFKERRRLESKSRKPYFQSYFTKFFWWLLILDTAKLGDHLEPFIFHQVKIKFMNR